MTYAVAFTNKQTGNTEFSRSFTGKKAALNWAKWLRGQNFVAETSVYGGELGGELLEREAA